MYRNYCTLFVTPCFPSGQNVTVPLWVNRKWTMQNSVQMLCVYWELHIFLLIFALCPTWGWMVLCAPHRMPYNNLFPCHLPVGLQTSYTSIIFCPPQSIFVISPRLRSAHCGNSVLCATTAGCLSIGVLLAGSNSLHAISS